VSTLDLVRDRKAVVGIIGMGYVGVPLARAFGEAGFRVVAFDIDPDKVTTLNAGKSYIGHVPSDALSQLRRAGILEATDDFSRLDEPDCILICVPTPLGEARDPDLRYVRRTAEQVAQHLRRGQLVVLESTTYPGTTREVVLPRLGASGLTPGKEFYLAYSPEREDPGNREFGLTQIPKVVGGINRESLRVAAALYEAVAASVVRVSSTDVAEAAKVLENIYRAVNIALVNELKVLFDRMDVDVWEVIEAAKSKPFGFHAFYPGPGWGGHCIPVDPFYLSWKARELGLTTHFIERAGEVNISMTGFVIEKVLLALNEAGKAVKGAQILILGVAYKPDVDDVRESPALPLIERLRELGATVSYNDPHVVKLPPVRDHPGLKMRSAGLTEELVEGQDLVLIVTNHSAYDYDWLGEHSRLIVDTRNAMPRQRHKARVYRA
jgi:UDP-N-acetyl-D-glucosamine dehydrogenase